MNKSIEKSTQDFKHAIEQKVYIRSAETYVDATRRNYEANDKLSTWVMGGSAALLGLFIANIDKVQSTFSTEDIRFMSGLVVCSILCGLVQRIFSMKIGFDITASEYARKEAMNIKSDFDKHAKEIKETSDKYGLNIEAKLDRTEFDRTLKKLFPFPISIWFDTHLNRTNLPKLEKLKKEMSSYIHQVFWLGFQLLFLLVLALFSILTI
ncbi:hypothetical protein [Vibrio diabolicus]|uniref:hypothetical protein n=1 Tax=Vibrio diabolicus TaxID=50719 RepID=UPI002150FBBB|nr:hypothetical protein [Vibrio diabolicus]MCE9832419.1 hypothetical protein [Vibrio diabolicus]